MAKKCAYCGEEDADYFEKGKFFCNEDCKEKFAEENKNKDSDDKQVCEFC